MPVSIISSHAGASAHLIIIRRRTDVGHFFRLARINQLLSGLNAVGSALLITILVWPVKPACGCATIAAALLSIVICCLSTTADPAVADDAVGMYSEAQAARGERLYETHCSACHGGKLEGKTAVPLSGDGFSSRWADLEHSVDDLLYITRTLMPYSDPGSLSKHEYLDIVTYILKVNGYPAGSSDLPLDTKTLGSIKLKR